MKLSACSCLEVIINPGSSDATCGFTEDCTVICNQTESCMDTIFRFYNHSINLYCSNLTSCKKAGIYTSNVQSLYVEVTGQDGFNSGFLITDSSDQNIDVLCNGTEGVYYVYNYFCSML